MTTTQLTILDLSTEVKNNLQTGAYKGDEKQVERLEEERNDIITLNREYGQKKRKLKKEIYSGKHTKMEIKGMLTELNKIENFYIDPAIKDNEIKMRKGEPFEFTIDLRGFTVDWRGEKVKIIKINSEEFRKEMPGTLELEILTKWRDSIESYIETEPNPNIVKGLYKLLSPVEKNIAVLEGDINREALSKEISTKEEYPMIIDMDEEIITVFISGAR